MTIDIGRRRFMALLIGATATQPIPLHAQPSGRPRTIGFLMGLENDAESQVRIKVFEQELQKEGWSLGDDLRIEYRFAAGDADRMRPLAKNLAALKPDLIVA